MRSVAISLGAAVLLGVTVTPATAQLNSIPVYTSPKGGTGISVFADYGKGLNEESGQNRALAARAVIGLAMLQLGAGIGTVNPEIAGERQDSFQWMATAALRLIGGGVMPLAVNIQIGYGRVEIAQDSTEVSIPISVGVGLSPPIPGFSLELWAAPRYSARDLKVGDLSVSLASRPAWTSASAWGSGYMPRSIGSISGKSRAASSICRRPSLRSSVLVSATTSSCREGSDGQS
jgi:hypothetical protein